MSEMTHEELRLLQEAEDLKWLLQQPQFRRWAVNHIYGACMVNKLVWDPSAKVHFLEGRRSVGIDTLTTFTSFPELYSQFEHERIQAEAAELARVKNTPKENEDGWRE